MTTRRLLLGLTLALAAAGAGGLAVQVLAQPANHPQIEAAHSAVSRLEHGEPPSAVVPASSVDIGSSSALFVIVTDARGRVLASSAHLAGWSVLPPAGVFDYVRANGEDRVTWAPAAGVRSWIVVDAFSQGFVIAGRSPSSTEQGALVALTWGSFAALGLAAFAGIAALTTR